MKLVNHHSFYDFIQSAHWEKILDPWVIASGSLAIILGSMSFMTILHWICILLSVAITVSKFIREYQYWITVWNSRNRQNNKTNKP